MGDIEIEAEKYFFLGSGKCVIHKTVPVFQMKRFYIYIYFTDTRFATDAKTSFKYYEAH